MIHQHQFRVWPTHEVGAAGELIEQCLQEQALALGGSMGSVFNGFQAAPFSHIADATHDE
jgi:hypothetical protein